MNLSHSVRLGRYLEVYPQLPVAMRPLEIVQQPGEIIYVPSGWWHMVPPSPSAPAPLARVPPASLHRLARAPLRPCALCSDSPRHHCSIPCVSAQPACRLLEGWAVAQTTGPTAACTAPQRRQ